MEQVKELQARYANNPEAANQAVQQLYQTENVNPLAGCLPALAQIPIFISLYRCVWEVTCILCLAAACSCKSRRSGYGAPPARFVGFSSGCVMRGRVVRLPILLVVMSTGSKRTSIILVGLAATPDRKTVVGGQDRGFKSRRDVV